MNPPEAEFQVTIFKLRKAFSRRSRAKTGKKCTKKRDVRAKLLFCLLKLLLFLNFLLPSASLDLKGPIIYLARLF